jgi:DNA-binding beta-propeller fold protein YncE
MKVIETAVAVACLLGCGNLLLLASDTLTARHIRSFGEQGQNAGQFNFPLGMIVDSRDRLIIADAQNNRIQICDEFGNCQAFGGRGRGPGYFRNPHGVAVDAQDRIYTVETHTNRVQIFSPDGDLLGGFGEWGSCLGCFNLPGDVAIDNRGRILVADERNYRVQTCTQEGVCTAFGSKGTLPGAFNWPRAIVVDKEDRIFVADRFNGRVQICNAQGICSVIGSEGAEVGQFNGPVELDLDLEGKLVVADRENHRIQVCGLQGDCWAFGSFGTGPGQFNHPLGVAVDSKGRIFVADSDNHRIQLFEVVSQIRINPGHAGAWFNPKTPGQGQLIDVEAESQFLFVSWFTFTDGASSSPDEPHWFTAQGNYSDNTADLAVYESLGGRFDDPQAVSTEPVGTATLNFSDCGNGQLAYVIDSWDLQGSFPLLRAIPGTENVCEELSGNFTGSLQPNDGRDGAWYDENTPGQGFLIDAHSNLEGEDFIFVAWFTYGGDSDSGQRWLTAQGPVVDSTADIVVYETLGGRFDDPQTSETRVVGTMTIDFTDCSNALLSYSITDEGLAGMINIKRAIPGTEALCQQITGSE